MRRIKTWEELTICDNFLFQKVMQNQRLCKRLIEKLLHIKVRRITYPDAEKTLAASPLNKNIRLDLYVETDGGTLLDIEMQTTDGAGHWLPKRMRYYQSMIDVNVLEKGADYTELKPSYVIFICTFDPFGLGRRVYTFRNRCIEWEGLELGDETTKIFLNAKGTVGEVDADIESFLAYVDGHAAEGEFTREVAREVERIKEHKETGVEYMTLMMELKRQWKDGYEEGEACGEANGKAKERASSVRSLMETLNMTAQQAMEALKIPAGEREECAARL